MQATKASHVCKFTFSSNHIKKWKNVELFLILYLTRYIQNIIILTYEQDFEKANLDILRFFNTSLQSPLYFTLKAHLILN